MKFKHGFSVACIILLSVFLSCGDCPGVEEEVMPLIMGLFGLMILITIALFIKIVIIHSLKKYIKKRKNKIDGTAKPSSAADIRRIIEGTWPPDCVQRAFVAGASWWQFHHNGSTMFSSERHEAEEEAVKRYGEPSA